MPCFLENETQLTVDFIRWTGVSFSIGKDLTPLQYYIYSENLRSFLEKYIRMYLAVLCLTPQG